MEFTGDDALHISDKVKTTLRDYIAAKLKADPYSGSYRDWGGVDVKLADELEQEAPMGRPLISIRTRKKTRANFKKMVDGVLRAGYRHRFELELHVLADPDSGALVNEDNPIASDSLLSDHLDAITGDRDNLAELEALGVEINDASERTEKSAVPSSPSKIDGLHTNTHIIVCTAITLED